MAKRFIYVVGRNLRALPRYLYGHSEIVALGQNDERQAAIVVVEADTEDRVEYLTDYQMGRLGSSGMWAVSSRDTYMEAQETLKNTFSVRVDRLPTKE